MDRHVCVHGHFYQPPRENPWLEAVEYQDSAYPYHDWNERIAAECYSPNTASRIMDAEGRIEAIVSNYARMSFNVGPTLLAWMEAKDPGLYEGILAADRESRERFGGHGSAIAQGYNHVILPLANARDKATQVRWGVRDFERRFGRAPEGMWLPETAVDLETLDLLAAAGIRYTVLAPRQAAQVRRREGRNWRDVSGDRIDPTMPYLCELPSGRTIVLFFYDGPISQAVAFEGILGNGEQFANRILSGFSGARGRGDQLVHLATDGESYGHHHKHGEMALSYALHYLEARGLATVTNYGRYLESHPPTHLVRIFENSSWSCVHGVERWRADCGCNSGGHAGWNQRWRGPLREALDWLRDAVAGPFERRGRELFADPWAARDGYIDIVLDRSRPARERFLAAHARGPLAPEEETEALRLMELQRHTMLMYTSCGWFFDEVSGLETTQVLQYAGRVVQLAANLFGADGVEGEFLARLERAPSNLPELGTARGCYERFVRPATIDLFKVGGHFAISSLFESYGEEAAVFCYQVRREDYRVLSAGNARLALGRARVSSTITLANATLTFGVLHLGDHNVSGGVRAYRGEESYAALVAEIGGIFQGADLPEILRAVDRHFGGETYSLKLLFRDEQRKILGSILEKTLAGTEGVFSQIYGQHAPLMRFLADLGHPLPTPLRCVAETALNTELRRALAADDLDVEQVKGLVAEAAREGAALDTSGLGFTMRTTLGRLGGAWRENPADLAVLQRLARAVSLAGELPFEAVFWDVQNIFFQVRASTWPELSRAAAAGDETARAWTAAFLDLGGRLAVRLPEAPAP